MAETNGNGRLRIDPGLLLQLIAWAIGLASVYAALSSRVAVVETKQFGMEQRMERVESKIDRILELVR